MFMLRPSDFPSRNVSYRKVSQRYTWRYYKDVKGFFFFAIQKIGSNLKYRDKEKVNDDIYRAGKTMCAQWL